MKNHIKTPHVCNQEWLQSKGYALQTTVSESEERRRSSKSGQRQVCLNSTCIDSICYAKARENIQEKPARQDKDSCPREV